MYKLSESNPTVQEEGSRFPDEVVIHSSLEERKVTPENPPPSRFGSSQRIELTQSWQKWAGWPRNQLPPRFGNATVELARELLELLPRIEIPESERYVRVAKYEGDDRYYVEREMRLYLATVFLKNSGIHRKAYLPLANRLVTDLLDLPGCYVRLIRGALEWLGDGLDSETASKVSRKLVQLNPANCPRLSACYKTMFNAGFPRPFTTSCFGTHCVYPGVLTCFAWDCPRLETTNSMGQ
jgi:hypothetical protein